MGADRDVHGSLPTLAGHTGVPPGCVHAACTEPATGAPATGSLATPTGTGRSVVPYQGNGCTATGAVLTRITALLAVLALALSACADADDAEDTPDDTAATEEPAAGGYDVAEQPDAAASVLAPTDGDTVQSPVTFELAADGVELAPAGEPAVGEGHLHVIVDIGCYGDGEIIPGPSDEDEAEGRFHLGDGSDSREIDLEPGTYELCVQLADGVHQAFGSTETITVTVE